MLIVKNLEKSFDGNQIIKNLSFSVADGDKVAVVGLNGAGKSTLFRILLDQISYDSGEFFMGKKPRIGWMPQTVDELNLPNDINVYDFLRSGRPLPQIESKITEIYQKIANGDTSTEILNLLGQYQNEFDSWDGYSAESELENMIIQMGVPQENLDKNLGELSGGQKSKISFVRTLYSRPDVLFLDEPTNHLDAASREWMMNYLIKTKSTVIFISHDEEFLTRVADKVLYLDTMSHTGTLYGFGYDKFIKTLAETNASLERQFQKQMDEINRIQKFIDAQRGKSGKIKRQAQSREKLLEKKKQNLVIVSQEKKIIDLDLQPNRAEDIIPIGVENLNFAYDAKKPVIKKLSFSLNRGEKFIIVGENGAGKSTLLKLIMGILKPDSGKIYIGKKTDLGYYAQEHETLDFNVSVFDNVSNVSNLPTVKLRSVLSHFNFVGDKLKQKVQTLSPGERSRLELCKLCLSGANTLLLDEPTNHLDVATKKVMAESLHDYGGTLLIVSHDLDFLRYLGVERMLMLPSGRLQFFDEKIVKRYIDKEKKQI
ncbi:MAG: ABC-F family ATP-binding cassette domain-containing protein [Alphaproteobacteria bacterium]|nr:ABC-F family ATP-binding cassette domain-containing protein [Alphaproteobacteria bacterium]